MTYLLMGLFIIIYAVIAVIGVKYDPDKQSFFDLSDSTVLKGLFCILVVLVHTPESWQNQIQDAMGSFAYIGVTFFFMTSAYGLKWGVLLLGSISYEVYLLHGTMFYVVMSIEAVSDSGVFIWMAISLIILSASIVSWPSDKLFHLIYYDL